MFAKVSVIERPFKKENPNFDIGSTYFALIVNDYVCMIVEDEPYTIAVKYFDVLEHYNVEALKRSIEDKIKVEQECRDTIVNLRENLELQKHLNEINAGKIELYQDKIKLLEKQVSTLNEMKTKEPNLQTIFGQKLKLIEFQ